MYPVFSLSDKTVHDHKEKMRKSIICVHASVVQRMKFYWRLDTKNLTLYKSETSSHYHREIQLADMLAVDQMVNPELYPLTPPHVFEIVTSAITYYVGVDMTAALSSDLQPAQPIDRELCSSHSTLHTCM